MRAENTIIAFSRQGEGVSCMYDGTITLSCCDVYGNEGGDWIGCIEDQYHPGLYGNICEDPFFCDRMNGDWRLEEDSPCAPFTPPNPTCSLIGAWSVGCGGMDMPVRDDASSGGIFALAIPSPVTTAAIITCRVPPHLEGGSLKLTVHDGIGRLIRALVRGPVSADFHGALWDLKDGSGRRVPAGAYFCCLSIGGQSAVRPVLVIR
jgi:hypothetical protein